LPRAADRQLGDVRRNDSISSSQCELDSHAEQSCVSERCALIIHDYERPVTVYGYDNERGKTLKIVDAVVCYTDPSTGDKWMLIINQALLVPGLQHPLICSNQLRLNDIRVNDEPKHMVLNPTEYTHAIAIKTPDDNEAKQELIIPLCMSGVFSYFEVTKPTVDQWEATSQDWHLPLTYDSPEWEPTKMGLEEAESAMVDNDGMVVAEERDAGYWSQERISRVIASLSKDQVFDPPAEGLAGAIQSHVQVEASSTKSAKPKAVKALKTGKKQWKVGPSALAKRWGIGIGAARRTIDATTQYAVRSLANPTLSRRFATHDRLLRFRRLPCKMYTDTMKSKTESWFRRNRYGQVYVTDFGWIGFYPMQKKSNTPDTLVQLAHEKGVPTHFVMDNAKEQHMGEFRKKCRAFGSHVRQTDTYSAWQNEAESGIRELKRGTGRSMVTTQTPRKLWDHCTEWKSKVISRTARGHYKLQSQVPETIITGQTEDISNLAEYGWYEWVKFHDYISKEETLGRWLGPADESVGSAMTSKILTKKCHIYITATLRPLTQEEWDSEGERRIRDDFDKTVNQRLGDPLTDEDIVSVDPDAITPEFEPYSNDVEGTKEPHPDADSIHRPIPDDEHDNIVEDGDTPGVADYYVGATVDIKHRGELRSGRVKERARDDDGQLLGEANSNPLLDTRKYVIEFPDGDVTEYTANVISESMIAQCDANGYDVKLMEAIIDHRKDGNAVEDADRYFTNRGRQYPKKTTAGWKLCVQWKGGSTSWEKLADLKESYPVQVAEYSKAAGIQHEPAFAWWTEHVLKKRDRMIAKVVKRYQKITHKFGIEIPRDVEHAYRIDRANGNNLWREAVEQEMKNVRVAFKIVDDDGVPPGYQQMTCHMIFDVKLGEGFRRKCRMVGGGHKVDTPAHLTYATVVSRETVRIALTIAALHDLEVKASDIQNAYLTAPCAEKIWTTLGPEFGPDAGKKALVVRALYGLPSAGQSFTHHLASCMKHMGYTQCRADPDLWLKPDVHPDGEAYYRYLLTYIDDILSIGVDATKELDKLDYYFKMKSGSVGDPDNYLGNKLKKTKLPNGVEAWGLSSSKYVQEAVANVERYLAANPTMGKSLKHKHVKSPWPSGYEAELDASEELGAKDATFYQHLIGVCHWIVELGRVDVITEVSILASYLCNPRDGHMDAALHLYSYLKAHHNARLILDPSYPDDLDQFNFIEGRDWEHFYGDVKEALPPDMPKPLGKEVDLRLWVDSSHANDKTNRRSRTGFFIFLNSALIQWLSKKQPTIETSVFGAEFVAMKHGIETVRGIRYKLRMMGVKLSGPTHVLGDNMSVIHNTQRPESTLKKKSNSICYHFNRESVAMKESLTAHVESKKNLADLATKIIPSGQLRESLVSGLVHDIYD